MAGNEYVRALKAVPLFANMSDRELKTVAKEARERTIRRNEEIVQQGGAPGPLFVVMEGNGTVIINERARRKIGPGGFFGEMALFERLPRTATVRADTEMRLLALSSSSFLSLLEDNWSVTRKVLTELSRRIRELDRKAEN